MRGSNNWSKPADLHAQLEKYWQRGEVLASLVPGHEGQAPLFPLCLKIKAPSSSEISEHFDAVRSWVAELKTVKHGRLEMREIKHRLFGSNALPAALWLDKLEDALAMLGKQRDAARFRQLIAATITTAPQLLPWLQAKPLLALQHQADWPALLAIVTWLQAHPRPGIYLRQVDLPGIHSKFIEGKRAILSELLDLSLPESAIDSSASGQQGFMRRYGFLEKPQFVRLRALDAKLPILPGLPNQDVILTAPSFAALAHPATRVFVTENEINYLAFPPMENALLIFGAGYGSEAMASANWLAEREIIYWGDIDSHGFAILDQLRSHLPQVQSLMMDEATLLAHQDLWGEDEKAATRHLPRLTRAESALYQALLADNWGKRVRLEQERIGFAWVRGCLGKLMG